MSGARQTRQTKKATGVGRPVAISGGNIFDRGGRIVLEASGENPHPNDQPNKALIDAGVLGNCPAFDDELHFVAAPLQP